MKFVELSNIFACFKLQNFVSRIIKKYKILCFLCIIVCGLVLAFREKMNIKSLCLIGTLFVSVGVSSEPGRAPLSAGNYDNNINTNVANLVQVKSSEQHQIPESLNLNINLVAENGGDDRSSEHKESLPQNNVQHLNNDNEEANLGHNIMNEELGGNRTSQNITNNINVYLEQPMCFYPVPVLPPLVLIPVRVFLVPFHFPFPFGNNANNDIN